MSNDVQITYVNNSVNYDQPTVFVFTKNMTPTFDVMADGIAWRIMPNIGKGSSSCFIYPIEIGLQAMWGGYNTTQMISAQIGERYTVSEDSTGIVLQPGGSASQPTAIEIESMVQVSGGIRAQICKDGQVLMHKDIVAYGQRAAFILHPKLYWGVASEIQEGQPISSAVLNSDHFFEQDIEGVTKATVTLIGNLKEGYRFIVDNQE